jgi:DNA repair protein SbcC/Rad50
MIPLQLELENFLSYRRPVALDLRGVHLACISGPNGAGKSALLDAITWSLFGQSRSRSDDDLVNRIAAGQGKAASVTFTFSLEDVTYRIIRQKQIGKTVTLEFQVSSGDDGWKSLSEGLVRKTQAAVESLLHMNYDTFTNASFLLQDQADAFTTKTPGKRKEVLADLLGVNIWDRHQERVTERRRKVESTLELVSDRLREIDRELDEEPERKRALAGAQEALNVISERLQSHEELLAQARKTEAAMRHQEQTVRSLDESVQQLEQQLAELHERQAERLRAWSEQQTLLDRDEEIERQYSSWQQARERLSQWQQKAERLNAIRQEQQPFVLEIERERTRLESRQSELERLGQQVHHMRAERAELELALEAARADLAGLAKRREALEQSEQALRETRQKLNDLEKERALHEQERNQLRHQAERAQLLQEEKSDALENWSTLETAHKEAAAFVEAVEEAERRLSELRVEHDTLVNEQARVREQMDEIRARLDQLEDPELSRCPLCQQALSPEHRLEVSEAQKRQGKQLGDKYRQNSKRLNELAEESALLEARVQGKRLAQLELQELQRQSVATQARFDEIDRSLAEWAPELSQRLGALDRQLEDVSPLNKLRESVIQLEAAVSERAGLDERMAEIQGRLGVSQARLAEIERTDKAWASGEPGSAAELDGVRKTLTQGAYAVEARNALALLEKGAQEVDYDPEAHQESRQRFGELTGAEADYQQLQQARAAAVPLRESLADLEQQIGASRTRLVELVDQQQAAREFLAALSEGGVDVGVLEAEVAALRDELVAAHRKVATAEQGVEVLARLRDQRQASLEQQADTALLIQRLRLLEKACGRDGVQALLIEQALPEVEENANELLERLTGGRMTIAFETQRRLKTRDHLAETLDIRISDGVGERPYENFSGGEQFRVNFAIRLALSRILARRAGARLQTLVIDEGFGSQDLDGRQRLVEAINTIQDDFQRVLVITHIDELRDAFPNRIEVEKGSEGSTLALM